MAIKPNKNWFWLAVKQYFLIAGLIFSVCSAAYADGEHIIREEYPFKHFPPRTDPLGAWIDSVPERWYDLFDMFEPTEEYIARLGLMSPDDNWYPLRLEPPPPYTYYIKVDAWNNAQASDTEKAILWTAYYTKAPCPALPWRPLCEWVNEAWNLLMAGNNPVQVKALIGLPPTLPYHDRSYSCDGLVRIDEINAALRRLNFREPVPVADMITLVCGWRAVALPTGATCSFQSYDQRARIIAMPSPFLRAEPDLEVGEAVANNQAQSKALVSTERRYFIFEPVFQYFGEVPVVVSYRLVGDAPLSYDWRTAAQVFVCDPQEISGLRAANQILTFAIHVVPFGGTAHFITFENDSIFTSTRGWLTLLGDVSGSLSLVGSALKSTRLLMLGLTADAGAIAVKVGAVINQGEITAADVGELTFMIAAFGFGVYTAKNYYLDRDFSSSARYADAPARHQKRYRLWARDLANRIFERSRTRKLSELLDDAAAARSQFDELASSPTLLIGEHGGIRGGRPGVLRTNPSERSLTPISESSPFWTAANRDLTPQSVTIMGESFLLPTRRVDYRGVSDVTRLIKLDAEAAQRLNAITGTTRYRANQIYSYHALTADVGLLRSRVFSLVRASADMQRPLAARKQDFAEAMYAYYTACIYENGSAGIGRSFFAGLYRKMFGRKMRDMADIDQLAQTALNHEEFVERMMQLL